MSLGGRAYTESTPSMSDAVYRCRELRSIEREIRSYGRNDATRRLESLVIVARRIFSNFKFVMVSGSC